MWWPSPSSVSLPAFLRLNWPEARTTRHLTYGLILGVSLSIASQSVVANIQRRRREAHERQVGFEPRPIELRNDEVIQNVLGLIGNTPLVRIASLSDALGCEIYGKAEWLNPGGSVKDRVALKIIEDAENAGLLIPHIGSRIFEGTVGSTGISFATVGRAKGYETTIIMPDDVAQEKIQALHSLGAEVVQVRPASIVDKKQFVNLARESAINFGRPSPGSSRASTPPEGKLPTFLPRPNILKTGTESIVVTTTADVDPDGDGMVDTAKEKKAVRSEPRGFFADQFENRANFEAHFSGTGPEIWRQTNGHVHAFVAGAGTGGTLAGVGRFLKTVHEDVVIALSDPQGSGLFNKVKHGVLFDRREAEGTKRRHQVDTVVEGIGINRLTHNFELALPIVDDAFRVTDEEAVAMSRHLVSKDGLFLGSSSACNLVACVKLIHARKWKGSGKRVVTILCDSGSRHYSKFWNDEYLKNADISIDMGIVDALLAGKYETR